MDVCVYWLLLYDLAYTMAKYGMSMCVLGMSEELKPDGIAVNALWPRTGMGFVDIMYIPYSRKFS